MSCGLVGRPSDDRWGSRSPDSDIVLTRQDKVEASRAVSPQVVSIKRSHSRKSERFHDELLLGSLGEIIRGESVLPARQTTKVRRDGDVCLFNRAAGRSAMKSKPFLPSSKKLSAEILKIVWISTDLFPLGSNNP